MFEKNLNNLKNAVKNGVSSLMRGARDCVMSKRLAMFVVMFIAATVSMLAADAGDYSAGTTALSTVADEVAKYIPIVVNLCYAIAGVVAIVGAISVYIAMNNEEQDVKKKIMMIVGACLFLIAAAQALPAFFGL